MNDGSAFITGTNNVGKSKYKGKIYKGTNYSPFERNNFGSIPSKFENLLIEKSKYLTRCRSLPVLNKGPSTEISISKNGMIKFCFFDQPTAQNNILNNSISNLDNKSKTSKSVKEEKSNSSNSNTNENNPLVNLPTNKIKYFGTAERFKEGYNTFSKRFYPGPSDTGISKGAFYSYGNNYKYNNLFKDKILPKKVINTKVGPGSYFIRELEDENKIPIKFGKEEKFFSIKEKADIRNGGFSGPGLYEHKGSMNVKEKEKPNYFFIQHHPKKTDYEKKYIVNDINRTNPELFEEEEENKKSNIKQSYHEFALAQVEKIQKRFDELKKERKAQKSQKQRQLDKYKQILDFQMRNYRAIKKLPYVDKGFAKSSSEKNFSYVNNHVPGPSYYNYDNILNFRKPKVDFHYNPHEIWT